ncbi:PREDICTED: nudix hydrolase 2 isoform X2 [Theobroma cacao]|uniref:Nudix hydrolase 2 isoform X2 n=1 Tax=Theobroma cacao TaxID=3641 RepID=A0AB32VRM0_THECC|nr:PREDICTED: nudix hydrolase 2 isoform X2 [Theobroma cacao]
MNRLRQGKLYPSKSLSWICSFSTLLWFCLPKGQYNSNSLSSVRYMSTSTSAVAIEKQMVPENEVQQVELHTGAEELHGGIILDMSTSTSAVAIEKQMVAENEVQQVELLTGVEDLHGGIILDMNKAMDSEAFASSLRASMSPWKQQGKRAVWIKVPTELVNLVEPAVKEGFRYHHAEPDYLMLVNWISNSTNTLPQNASHRVGIGAFVVNDKREVLVVQEKNGRFKGTGVWKFPTGVVNEGEDIYMAAIREVKEETGIDTEFVEILAFSGCHLRTMQPNLLSRNIVSLVVLPKYA